MKRLKKFLDDLGIAADNLLHVLITTREHREGEADFAKFCQQMRGLGQDPGEVMSAAAQAVAVGIEPWQLTVLARLFARGEVDIHGSR